MARDPELKAASRFSPVPPTAALPLISYVVAAVGVMDSVPPPLVLLLKGMAPMVKELDVVVVLAVPEPETLCRGPRMRTCLLSMGSELAAIKGVTTTVLLAKSTRLDAAMLKSMASSDAPLAATLNELFGSRVTVI